MTKNNISKIWDFLKKKKLDGALFSNLDSIFYITGYSNQTDSSFPFNGCPVLLIVLSGEEPRIILPITEKDGFKQVSQIKQISAYINYDYQKPLDISKNMVRKTLDVFQDLGIKKEVLGYEAFDIQANVFTGIGELFPQISWEDITGELTTLRAIKTSYEIEMIRQSACIADIGQNKIRELASPGKSEIAIYSEARAYMEVAAGKRIREAGDFVSGKRCGTGGEGRPLDIILKEGDLLISDIIPRLDGWFADCTCTTSIGKPSTFNKKIFQIVMDALKIGVESAKPGMLACELDTLVRGYIEKHGYRYEHHTGHGVGICQFESPWIVPYNKEALKEGMVITLEPAIYAGGKSGVRIEGLFLITKDHLESLTNYQRQLEP